MLTSGEIPTDEKVPVELTIQEATETVELAARAERRGGYSISFPKHSYEIDLKDDLPLLGLEADDDWILNASHIDKTFLRHKLAYDLFREMNADNRAPACRYFHLTLDGAYNGLYILMEKPDRSLFEVKKKDEGAFIFKDPFVFRPDMSELEPEKPGNRHHQTFPDLDERDHNGFLDSLHATLTEATPADAFTLVQRQFDLDNLLDWHLLLLITNNSDGILKNFYLYRWSEETPIRIAPWDYDHSFGRDGDNELNLDSRPLDIRRSLLFDRLLSHPAYRKALLARWNEMNQQGLISVPGLQQRINTMASRIRSDAVRNASRWPYSDPLYYDDNDFDAEIDVMLEFLDLRHDRLSTYFANLPD